MAIPIYIILHVIAVSSHFFNTTLPEHIFLVGILIPISDFVIKIVRKRKLTWSTLRLSTSFFTLSVINYNTFSYHDLSYKNYLWGIVIVCALLELIFNYEEVKKHKIRFSIYCFLTLVPMAHASMSHIQLMYFYTLGEPIEAETDVKKLSDFAYLHYQQGEKEKAIMYLNKAEEVILHDFYSKETVNKEKLKQTYNEIQENMLLLLQDKWIIKGRFD